MPFIQRASFFPEWGKEAEVQAIAEARVRAIQDGGRRASLSQTAFGPDMPAFHLLIVFEDLEDYQQYAESAGAAQAELRTSLAPLVRKPSAAALLENMVASPRPIPPGGFVLWTTRTPLPDKVGELAALCAEWARTRNSQGYLFGFGTEIAGAHPTASITSASFDRLKGLQDLRERARTEEASQKFQRDSGALTDGQPTIEILRVVVSAPPRAE
jgi:hypothetical protein